MLFLLFTLCFCTGSYAAASTTTGTAATGRRFWLRDNFRTSFEILPFLAGLMGLTYRLPDLILVDFRRGLDLKFSRSNIEFAISHPDRHEIKSKHIDWILGTEYEHRVWPWPWPWPWIFKVKYRIWYISAKNGPIATKRKMNISIEH